MPNYVITVPFQIVSNTLVIQVFETVQSNLQTASPRERKLWFRSASFSAQFGHLAEMSHSGQKWSPAKCTTYVTAIAFLEYAIRWI